MRKTRVHAPCHTCVTHRAAAERGGWRRRLIPVPSGLTKHSSLMDKISQGKSYTVLREEYGVGRSAISDIKKREPALRSYKRKMVEMGVERSAKVMKLGKDEQLKAALFLWFKQKREEGTPITGPIVQAKARELH